MSAIHRLYPDRPAALRDGTGDVPCLDRKLAAILMADAVAFTERVQADERATLAALREARRLIRAIAPTHCGRVVDTAGDSLLAEFPSVVGAVAAAISFQSSLAGVPGRLAFRVGVHFGDVISEPDGTIFGDGVNLAARLQSLADPGGILVSRAVHEEVRGKLPVGFRSRGRYHLKNMRWSVPCFEIVTTGTGDNAWADRLLPIRRIARRPTTWVLAGLALVGTIAAACLI